MNKKILIPIVVILIISAGIGAYFIFQKPVVTADITVDYSKELGTFSPYIFGTIAAPYFDENGYVLAKEAGFKLIEIMIDIDSIVKKVPENSEDSSQYDFTILDQQVSAAINNGLEPVITLGVGEKRQIPDLDKFAAFVKNVAKHLTQGWGNGHNWNVKIFAFTNEPDNAGSWHGTQQEYFEAYAAYAKALRSVNPKFILYAPGLMTLTDEKGLVVWFTDFLDYVSKNNVPLDFYSLHAYSPLTYYKFYEELKSVQSELKKYKINSLYGTTKLSNDEWNMMVGDNWSGSYHDFFDTAWAAAHNIIALSAMVENGLELSIRYGGTFNGGQGGCHDFPLIDCSGNGKPAYYAFKGFNWLADTNRLSTTGTDHMNFAAIAGKSDNGIIVVISNYDVKTYLEKYEPKNVSDRETAWTKEYNPYVSKFGEPKVYNKFNLTLNNLPWTSSQQITYERYLVDDSHKLELVESQTLSGSKEMKFSEEIVAPSVQVIKLRVK